MPVGFAAGFFWSLFIAAGKEFLIGFFCIRVRVVGLSEEAGHDCAVVRSFKLSQNFACALRENRQ